MGDWISEMAAYIKGIDDNHLVGIGGQSRSCDAATGDTQHNGSFSGQDYRNYATDENIDFFDVHWYPWNNNPTHTLKKYGQALGFPNEASKGGFITQLDEYVVIAKAAGKPVICDEMGMGSSSGPTIRRLKTRTTP